MTNEEKTIKQLNDEINRLKRSIEMAGVHLKNISDVIEVMHYYANEDDTRLGGALSAVNSMILRTWFDLEDDE